MLLFHRVLTALHESRVQVDLVFVRDLDKLSILFAQRLCVRPQLDCVFPQFLYEYLMKTSQRRVMVISSLGSGQHRELLQGIVEFAASMPTWSLHHHMALKSIRQPLPVLLERLQPDGVILEGWQISNGELSLIRKAGIPAVGVFGQPRERCSWVLDDTAAGARMAIEHFEKEGQRQLAFISHSADVKPVLEPRHEAFRVEAARRPGISAASFPEKPGRDRIQTSEHLAQFLLDLPKPSGVLCFTAQIAEEVLALCEVNGIDIPGDLAVLATGADSLERRMTHPRLSSLDPGDRRIGYEAAAMLHRQITAGQLTDEVLTIPPGGIWAEESTDVTATRDPNLRRALQIMRARLGEPLRAPQIARSAGMSERKMNYLFRDIRGRSFGEELRLIRLKQAQEMLRETSLSLEVIAATCGFGQASHMNKVFQDHLGATPGQVRRGQ